ncbi:MAG: hypothetical protein AAF752_09455 [Bacteroidota bacterium]
MTDSPRVRWVPYGLLAVLLVGPFLVREAGWPEPYPAVLLPTGANRILVSGDTVRFTRTLFEGISASGERTEVSAQALLHPLSPPHAWNLSARRFGTTDPERSLKRFGVWSLGIQSAPPATAAERDEARRWLKQQLSKAGVSDPKALEVSTERISVDLATGALATRAVQDSYRIELEVRDE